MGGASKEEAWIARGAADFVFEDLDIGFQLNAHKDSIELAGVARPISLETIFAAPMLHQGGDALEGFLYRKGVRNFEREFSHCFLFR